MLTVKTRAGSTHPSKPTPDIEPRRHPAILATAWMAGALVSFAGLAIGGREASYEIGTFEILFFRSLFGVVAISALLHQSGWDQIGTRMFGTHVVRNLSHFVGQFGWFYGIALIPLAEVFAIEFTLPVWTAILAALILGERLTKPRLAAIGFGFLGMLIILRPGVAVIHPASLAVLVAAIAFALAHVMTRKLAIQDTPLAILFYMSVMQLPLSLLLALPDWVMPSMATWPWILVIGITGLTSNYCLARALSLADATVVVPMDFLRVPLIAFVGAAYYSEPWNPYVLAGAAVMFVGNILNVRAESKS